MNAGKPLWSWSNLPNLITLSRLILSVVLFVLLSRIEEPNLVLPDLWAGAKDRAVLYNVSLVLFLVAAFSDILDGELARRWKSISAFGRIADPFVDKITNCGCFVFFASVEGNERLVSTWMVVLILGREFLVTGLRGYMEGQGRKFPSNLSGKIKMVIQCVAIGAIFCYHANFEHQPWAYLFAQSVLWLALASTFWSGWVYLASTFRSWPDGETGK